jgi:hypothetical protein
MALAPVKSGSRKLKIHFSGFAVYQAPLFPNGFSTARNRGSREFALRFCVTWVYKAAQLVA